MLRPLTILKLLPQIIMGCLGYAKIPLDIVRMSTAQEDRIKYCKANTINMHLKGKLDVMLEFQKELTIFLRNCRAIAPKEKK